MTETTKNQTTKPDPPRTKENNATRHTFTPDEGTSLERSRVASVLQSVHKLIGDKKMPLIMWLLGVPLSVIILLALFGAF
jgi:hypothetical protein